jgi:hypothetical protein
MNAKFGYIMTKAKKLNVINNLGKYNNCVYLFKDKFFI